MTSLYSDNRFFPDEAVPRSGVYRTYHYAHRLPHVLFLSEGDKFPECNKCGAQVRYSPMMPASLREEDEDFRGANDEAAAAKASI